MLGAVEALRQRRQAVPQALGLALFLFALPGFSTRDVEFYRLVLLILPLTVLAALGLTVLTASLPRRPRILALALLLAASTGWDTYHWAVASPAYFRSLPAQNLYAKPLDRIRAFQVLSQKARRDGPGLFLNELIPNAEQDLMLMTYPFNAARNPALSPERAQWWAILVNANLGPFLAEEFPSMAWHRVSEGLETRSGGILLGIGPLQSGPENRIDRYLAIQRGLVGFQSAIMRRSPVGSDESLRILDALHPLFRGDRFLETTYWENREVACELGGDREGALEACQGAVRDGYPAAHLFFKMGLLCLNNGDSKEAAGYFRRALACPFNLTPARLFLDDFGRPAESK